MKEIKISIVIPLHNAELYIEKCLCSILKNKTNKYEIIIINDGSTDNSETICKEIIKQDKRVKYIYKKNEGCSKARNIGINMANGKYIWFVDSDDFLVENAIDNIIIKLEDNEDIDVMLFGYKICYKSGNVIYRIPKNIREKKDIYNQMLFFNSSWNKLYKKNIITEANISFLENCHMGEDMNFNFKFFSYVKEKKIKVEEKNYYNYVEANGVTSNFNRRKEIFIAFDDIFNFFYENKNFKNMEKILKKYYKQNVIRGIYDAIIREKIKNKNLNIYMEIFKIYKEIAKRKNIFNSYFFKLQLIYCIKLIIYPIYYKIKNKKFY